MNDVKARMRKGKPTVGGWLLSGSPVIAEVMAHVYDWIAIDLEHGSMTMETVEHCCRAIERGGAEPFARVSEIRDISKALDAGVTGIIFADVRDGAEADAIVRACKYPPLGERSYSLSRCTRYGEESATYFNFANGNITVVLMIEHHAAARRMDEILTTPNLDGILIGPYDLSGSLGKPGRMHDDVVATIDCICAASSAQGIAYGMHDPHATPGRLQDMIRDGMRFVAVGMDTTTLSAACVALAKQKGEENES